MIKVVIADDQELIRESLKIVLGTHEDIQVVSIAADGLEVLDILKMESVDVILMDIRILTTFDDDDFVFSALKYGASGYLLKGVGMDELYQAILTVYRGGGMINPDIATKVFGMFSKMSQNNYSIQVDETNIDEISKPEWKVIQQVGYGFSNKEIAQKLYLSEGTVRNYLSSILSKLNLRDRTQLAIWAVQTGQITKEISDE